MTPAPAFLFDLDGTLAETLPDIAASTNFVRRQHGLPALPDDVVRSYIGDGARTLLRRALHELLPTDASAQHDAIETALRDYIAHHHEQCTRLVTLFPGVHEHLSTLSERGHALAVVTNKPAQFAVPLVRHLQLDGLIAAVVGGDTLPQKKPDPAPLQHALELLGCPTDGATMVGDGLQDLRAGKALQVRTIACLFGYGDVAALQLEGADEYWRAFAVPV